jgi:hypothetical protein
MPVKRKGSKKMRKSRRKSRTQKGGEMSGMNHGAEPMFTTTSPMEGGSLPPLSPHVLEGGRRNRGRKSKRKSKTSSQCGGDAGVLTTAAVPFGLLALQRFFKGSRKTKSGVRKMGRSFKRTFRRRK